MLPPDRQSAKRQVRQEIVHSTNGVEPRTERNGGASNGFEIGSAFSSETQAQVLPTRRTDRLRRAVSLTCRAIIRGYDKDAILSECCRYLVDEGGYDMAWAGLSSDDDPARIVPKAHVVLTLAMDGADRRAQTTQSLLQTTALSCVQKRSPQVVRPVEPKTPNGDTPSHQGHEVLPTVCAVPMELGPHGQGALALGIEDPDAFRAEEVALLRDLADDLGHGISMLMDRAIAEKREDRLLLDREFHVSLFNHAPEGAFVATTGGRLVQANPAFARLLGYPDAQSLLADPSASLYTIVAPKEKHLLMAALEDDSAPRTHDLTMRRKDSAAVQVKVTVQSIQGAQGKYLEAFVHDLSVPSEQHGKNPGSAAMVDPLPTPAFRTADEGGVEEHASTSVMAADSVTAAGGPEHPPHTPMATLDAMRCALKNTVTPILNHAELLADRIDEQDANRKSVMVINRNANHAAKLLHAMDAAMTTAGQADSPTTAPSLASFLRKAMDDYGSTVRNAAAD